MPSVLDILWMGERLADNWVPFLPIPTILLTSFLQIYTRHYLTKIWNITRRSIWYQTDPILQSSRELLLSLNINMSSVSTSSYHNRLSRSTSSPCNPTCIFLILFWHSLVFGTFVWEALAHCTVVSVSITSCAVFHLVALSDSWSRYPTR